MRAVGRVLAVVAISLVAIIGALLLQSAATAANSASEAFAQAENRSVTTRIVTWTRARLAAAKTRWARNQEKFSDCVHRLDEQQKAKRFSRHDQGHFLENCMREKP